VINGNARLEVASGKTKARAADAGGRNFSNRISPSRASREFSQEKILDHVLDHANASMTRPMPCANARA